MANSDFDTVNTQLQNVPQYRAALQGAVFPGSPFQNPTNQYQRAMNARAAAQDYGGVVIPGGHITDSGEVIDPNDEPWYFDPRIVGPIAVAGTGILAGLLGGGSAAASSGAASSAASSTTATTGALAAGGSTAATIASAASVSPALAKLVQQLGGGRTTTPLGTYDPVLASSAGSLSLSSMQWWLVAGVAAYLLFGGKK